MLLSGEWMQHRVARVESEKPVRRLPWLDLAAYR
jgi:hypothetical protein